MKPLQWISGTYRVLMYTRGTSTNAMTPKTAQTFALALPAEMLPLRIRYATYRNHSIAEDMSLRLGVHHTPHVEWAKIEPVMFKTVAKTKPISPAEAANLSHEVRLVLRYCIEHTNRTAKHANEAIAAGTWM